MSNPWTILGWSLIVLILLKGGLATCSLLEERIIWYLRYRKSRAEPFAAGQVWMKGMQRVDMWTIAYLTETTVHLESKTSWATHHWNVSVDELRKVIRREWMYCFQEGRA